MNSFNLQDISTFRSSLMGIAIIWILLYHFGIEFPIIGRIVGSGFIGVDIFMFLSGFGLYYSLSKSKNDFKWKKYINKRILKIFPVYILIGVFLSLFCYNDNLLDYLWKCTTLGYWSNNIYYEWFIPSILALYAIYPLLYFSILQKEGMLPQIFLIILTLLLAFFCIIFPSITDNWHFLLIYRIPIFLFGSFIAFCIKKQKSNKFFLYPTLIGITLFVILIITNHLELRYYYFAFTFITPLILIICILLYKNVKFFNKHLAVIGTCTLEIYLIHLIFLKYLKTVDYPVIDNYHNIVTILLCLISIALGYVLKKSIDFTKNKIIVN